MQPEVANAFEIGPTAFIAILGSSAIVFALALEQLYTFWRLVDRARDLGTQVGKCLYSRDLAAARTACERSDSPVADIFIAALNKVNRPGESTHRAAERERQRFGLWMRRRLWALGSIGALAPFVGLFGTVFGIIRSFKDIAASGSGGFQVVASGVSEALVATAGGILVAIIAVLFYNYFQTRGTRAAVEVKLVIDEFLEQLDVLTSGSGVGTPPSASSAEPISEVAAAPALSSQPTPATSEA
ncbi:MAG: MotA/TolQ/ExbB proton channel family protein [Myxococcota bacterium]